MCIESKSKQMKELFERWKNDHNRDSGCDNQDVFIPDGIICEEEYEYERPEILFISKESNLDPALKNNEVKGNTDCFWVRSTVISGNAKAETGSGTKYINVLANLCNSILEEDKNTENKSWDNLKKCAYINLNKRGGHGSCDNNALVEYVKKHKLLIRQQIRIIDPKVIVCCSKTVYDLVTKTLNITPDDIKWTYHPSCRRSYKTIRDKMYS